ncbi:MAG: outer-membrane lipoprotein carrier protein LolA [Pseudomonadota bacterium]
MAERRLRIRANARAFILPALAASASACALLAPAPVEANRAAAPAVSEDAGQSPLPSSKDSVLSRPPELRGGSEGAAPDAPAVVPTAASGETPQAAPSSAESDAASVDQAIAYIEGLGSLKGRFTQFADNGDVATGAFYLKRPGRIRFDYDPPSPILVVADGVRVIIQDRELETTDGYPIRSTPLKFLLAKKIDRDDLVITEVARSEEALAITATARDEETPGSITLGFALPDMQLRQWVVIDGQNRRTTVSLTDLQSDVELDPALFRPKETRRFLDNRPL